MKNLTRVAIAFIKNDRTHFLHERKSFDIVHRCEARGPCRTNRVNLVLYLFYDNLYLYHGHFLQEVLLLHSPQFLGS